jgi:hypothetical protein
MFPIGSVLYNPVDRYYGLKRECGWLFHLTRGGATKFLSEMIGDKELAIEIIERSTQPSAAHRRLLREIKAEFIVAAKSEMLRRKLRGY